MIDITIKEVPSLVVVSPSDGFKPTTASSRAKSFMSSKLPAPPLEMMPMKTMPQLCCSGEKNGLAPSDFGNQTPS